MKMRVSGEFSPLNWMGAWQNALWIAARFGPKRSTEKKSGDNEVVHTEIIIEMSLIRLKINYQILFARIRPKKE